MSTDYRMAAAQDVPLDARVYVHGETARVRKVAATHDDGTRTLRLSDGREQRGGFFAVAADDLPVGGLA